MIAVARAPATLFAGRNRLEALAELAAGDTFEVLELAGSHAWGVAPGAGLVGYIDRAVLDRAA